MARCESESDFSGDEIECFHSDIAEDESEDDGNLYYGVSGPGPYKFEPLASARKWPISCTSGRTNCPAVHTDRLHQTDWFVDFHFLVQCIK